MALFKKHKTEPVPPEDTGAHDTSVGTAADVEAVMKKYDRESNTRVWEGLPKLVIRWLMVAFSAYCIIDTVFLSTRQEVRLPMYVGLILLFGFLTFPAKKGDERVNHMPWYDIVLLIAGPGAYFFYAVNAQNVVQMSARVMQNDLYMIIGLIGILALVELCRRCVGLPILVVLGPTIGVYLFREPTVGEYIIPLSISVLLSCYQSVLAGSLNGVGKQSSAAVISSLKVKPFFSSSARAAASTCFSSPLQPARASRRRASSSTAHDWNLFMMEFIPFCFILYFALHRMAFQIIPPFDAVGRLEMDSVRRRLGGQHAVFVLHRFGNVEILHALFPAHLHDQGVVQPDPLVVEHLVVLRPGLAHRHDGLDIDHRIRLQPLELIHQLAVSLDEHLLIDPAQLVDAQHQVDLSAVCGGHGLCQRDLFPIFALPVFQFRSGGHCFSGNAEICASVQSAVKPEAISPGVPHKSHIVKIAVIHRR